MKYFRSCLKDSPTKHFTCNREVRQGPFSFKVSFSLPLKSESCRVIFPAIRSTNSQTERCRTQATHPAGKWYWGTLAQIHPVPSTGLAICLSFWTKSSVLDATLALTKDGLSQTKEADVSISIFNTWLLSEGFRKPHVIPFRQNYTDVAWQLDALPTASSLTPPLGTAPLASHSEIPHVCVMIFMTKLCACMPDALCSNLCNCPGYHHFAENENPPAYTSWACLATKPQGQFLAESDTPGPNEASGGVQ